MRLFIVLVFALASGCTSKLWELNYEKEELSGFFVSDFDNQLLVSGKEHAYKFDIDPSLTKTLNLSRSIEFLPNFQWFELSSDNKVSGVFRLFIEKENYDDHLLQELIELGFTKYVDGRYVKKTKLKGMRYRLKGGESINMLENKIIVTYQAPRTGVETAGNIIVTPVTVLADAVFIPVVIVGYVGFVGFRAAFIMSQ